MISLKLTKISCVIILLVILLLFSYRIIIEAMSDRRYIVNRYPGGPEGEESRFLSFNKVTNKCSINSDLFTKSNRLIDQLYERINVGAYDYNNTKDYTIYTGYGGIALLHFLNYQKRNNSDSLNLAGYLIGKALAKLKGRDVSFLLGDAGPLALGAVLYSLLNKNNEVVELISRLIELPLTMTNFPDEVLYGRAGYIYALLFVNKYLPNIIPDEHLQKQVKLLLHSGKRKANQENFACPLKYDWSGENYLGAAHGLAGILYILLYNKRLLDKKDIDLTIKPSLEWLIAKKYPTNNFPSSDGSKSDKLVQWCHGAPGFVYLFTLANKVYGDDRYLKLALACGDVVWERGILQKGYSICHGVSGNAYTFAHLYQTTNDPLHLHRLAAFIDWVNTYPKNEGMRPDRPLSMFEGISGVNYFLTDVQDPINSAFPAYGLPMN